MAIDFIQGYNSPDHQPSPDGVPNTIPHDLEYDVVSRNLQESVYNHRTSSAAAEAVSASLRPEGEALRAVQNKVGEWVTQNYPEELSKVGVRRLFADLYAGRLGAVSLYDLDTTVAFARRLWAEELASRHGIYVSHLGRTATEDAPALLYVPPEMRVKIASSLGLNNDRLPSLYNQPAPLSEAGHLSEGSEPNNTAPPNRAGSAERRESMKLSVRDAKAEDIPAMVEVDMRSFHRVYQGYGMTESELRADVQEKFMNRYRLLGGKWMPVVTTKDKSGKERIVGFMIGCPTSKGPDDFESWEKTTGNGTIVELYDPKGKHLYVVTLSMDPSVHGQSGEDQAYMRLMSRMIEKRLEYAYFESRMPGFRTWVKKHCREGNLDFDQVRQDEEGMMLLAKTYSTLTRVVDGKEVPYDKLLRLYSIDFGCNLERVVANAYKDEPSMNFGAVYTFDNPIPRSHRGRVTSWAVGRSLGIAAKSSAVSKKVMKKLQELLG